MNISSGQEQPGLFTSKASPGSVFHKTSALSLAFGELSGAAQVPALLGQGPSQVSLPQLPGQQGDPQEGDSEIAFAKSESGALSAPLLCSSLRAALGFSEGSTATLRKLVGVLHSSHKTAIREGSFTRCYHLPCLHFLLQDSWLQHFAQCPPARGAAQGQDPRLCPAQPQEALELFFLVWASVHESPEVPVSQQIAVVH